MSTWTMDQVFAVRRFYAKATVDASLVASDAEVIEYTRQEMAKRIAGMAQALAVEVDARDVHIVDRDEEDAPFRVKLTAAWMPEVKAIELRGGPNDGEVWQVRDIWTPVLVPLLSAPTWLEDDAAPTRLDRRIGRYDLDGWREDERRWVFAYRG